MVSPGIAFDGLSPGRVCVIKPSSLGDVVHSMPILPALRSLWPRAEISWVVNRGLRGLLDGHPDLHEVIPFDRVRRVMIPKSALSVGSFLADLRRRRFDLTIDLQGLLRSGVMAAATGAAVRVGFADAREGAARFYTHRVLSPMKEVHAVDRVLAVARALGAADAPARFALPVSEGDRLWAAELLAGVARPALVLNLGARWDTKRWPAVHFAEIARRAAVDCGAGTVVVGAGEDRGFVEDFRARLGAGRFLDLTGRTTLPRLAAVSAAADLFLSSDTGPLHLAAAAGARVVGLYTCTNENRTGPYGPKALALGTTVPCAASYRKTCGAMVCMAELTPDRVWPVVRGLLVGPLRLTSERVTDRPASVLC